MRMLYARYNEQVNAIDEPLEYARLALSGEMQIWVDAVDEEWDIW